MNRVKILDLVVGTWWSSARTHMSVACQVVSLDHRLNMELDLQSLFGLLCTAVLIG